MGRTKQGFLRLWQQKHNPFFKSHKWDSHKNFKISLWNLCEENKLKSEKIFSNNMFKKIIVSRDYKTLSKANLKNRQTKKKLDNPVSKMGKRCEETFHQGRLMYDK